MNDQSERRDTIVRYSAGDRTNHWVVAICFLLLALSGLALFHPAMFWLSNLFGGGTWTRILHPFIGVVMFVAFILLSMRVWSDNRMSERDWQWLKQWREVIGNREENVPEAGRYNGGQKLLFFVLVLCMLGLLVSGFVIWRPYFAPYFPVGLARLAATLHAICAFAMICAIIIHVYAGIWVKGSVSAMTRGTVTPGWAWKHHRAWFRDMIRRGP
ncbi:MAG TPA: formate dehydrogenase subunit gamma [Rhodanobacteraceae bacterium]|nr:formate dehydrogenase subunit gamma [Rhodanobacteraceae bacterium]